MPGNEAKGCGENCTCKDNCSCASAKECCCDGCEVNEESKTAAQ